MLAESRADRGRRSCLCRGDLQLDIACYFLCHDKDVYKRQRQNLTFNHAALDLDDVLVFVDYKGITVAQDTELRNQFRAAGVEYAVVKNTLTRFAANKAGYTEFDELLNGTTSMASTTDDPIAPARVVCEFAKKNKNVVKIKGGMVEGKVLSVEELMSFGELPSKNALVAQVLGTFLAPISSLAVVLNQILEQKGGAPAEEAPAEA